MGAGDGQQASLPETDGGRAWYKKYTEMTTETMNKQQGLHSNKAINAFTGVPEMGLRMFSQGQGIGDAFRETFYDAVEETIENGTKVKMGKGFRWGKAAGSAWAAYTGAKLIGGAVRGALTDSNGNFDVPGIPGI